MGLFDGIEKLITEHGSAAILRERIALAADQYSTLEKENVALKTENQILKSENQRLKLDNSKLKEEIRNLENQLSKLSNSHNQALEKVKENILLFLSKQKTSVFADQVAQYIGIETQTAMFHLEELNAKVMVLVGHSGLTPPRWSLAKEGRKYLVQRSLIS